MNPIPEWVKTLDEAGRAAVLAEILRGIACTKLWDYKPYEKQRQFHEAGATYRERMFFAGNRLGKSLSVAMEISMHLTGIYPPDWRGKRFHHAVRWGVASETGLLTRDGIQTLLFGAPSQELGTGTVPLENIVRVVKSNGVPGLFDYVVVRHESGGESICYLRSYDQGRERIQAMDLHGFSFDEEPPEDYYFEALTRTNTTLGPITLSFTPLKGMSRVVKRFRQDKFPGTWWVQMTIHEVTHFSEEEKKVIIASYPEHLRSARAFGEPMLGEGLVFPIDEELIKCEPFALPAHWARIGGMDFGFTHPTAAAWLAHDRDSNTVYVYDCHRLSGEQPPIHASAIKARGQWIPMAWPHDGQNQTAAGPQLAKQYRDEGVNMRPENAKFPETSDNKNTNTRQSLTSVEAGVQLMLTMMLNKQFKVFRHLLPWFEEFRSYHREKGLIVKIDDDLLSATRYALMDLRFAITQPVATKINPNRPVSWRT